MLSNSISVVMAAYNAAKWIGAALDSVLAQSLAPIEVLVIDDGSTDQTPRIVDGFGAQVVCIRETHRGTPHRNRGIRDAKGDWIAFIDADDLWYERKLELQSSRLELTGYNWAICDADWISPDNELLPGWKSMRPREGDILESLLLNNFIVASSVMVRRDLLSEVGYFDETSQIAAVEDWDLWLRLARRSPLACLPEKLVGIRLHADSYLASVDIPARAARQEEVVDRAVRLEPDRLGSLRGAALANIYFAAGVQLTRESEPQGARGYFLKALLGRPTRLECVGYLLVLLLPPRTANAVLGLARRLRRDLVNGLGNVLPKR